MFVHMCVCKHMNFFFRFWYHNCAIRIKNNQIDFSFFFFFLCFLISLESLGSITSLNF